MPTYQDSLFSGLVTDITATWTEIVNGLPTVAGSIHRTQSMNRANWENLVNSGKFVAPYVIVEVGAQTPEDWILDGETYNVALAVYYVMDLSDTNALSGGALKPTAYLQNKMSALATKMIYTPTGYQLRGRHPSIDCTESNVPNVVFYGLQAPKVGGALYANVLVGQY